jgi:hypothetical protein
MLLLQAIDLIIVLAHKKDLQRRQIRVLLRPHVAGRKGRALRAIDDGQVVALRHLHMTVGGPQARCGGGVRSVYLRSVQPARDRVDSGCRFPGNTGRRIDGYPRQRNAAAGRQKLIILRDGDRDISGCSALLQIQIVIDELAPRIHHA